MRDNSRPEMPPLFVLADQLKGAHKDITPVIKATAFHVEALWAIMPAKIAVVRAPWGGWYSSDKEGRSILTESLTEQIVLDGRWNDNPVELAKRYQDLTLFYYGQCPRKGHWLHVSPYFGAEPASLVTDKASITSVLRLGLISNRFSKQIGVCAHHEEDTCVTCTQVFRLMEQEPRFWGAKNPECGNCLRHYLMYVEARHNARALVVRKHDGRREVYRRSEWGVDFVPIPVGVDPPSTAQVQPEQTPQAVFAQQYQSLLINNHGGGFSTSGTIHNNDLSIASWDPEA